MTQMNTLKQEWPMLMGTARPTYEKIGTVPVNQRPDDWVRVTPPEGSAIRCSHCNSVAACVSGDNLIVVQRHHGNYHKSVISLEALGYVRVLNTK